MMLIFLDFIEMTLETFQKKFDTILNKDDISILLANGFSQAWDHTIFNYKSLFEKASFGTRDTEIRNLFLEFETFDFEKIMRALESAQKVCESYGVEQDKISEIKDDQEQLKNSLVEVISQTHPLRSSSVQISQYEKAKPFIKKFSKIFTLNYDLLLYWIINKNDISPVGYFTDDGFRGELWENTEDQNVFYLHGGLHLYDNGVTIKKHRFKDYLDKGIVDHVKENLNQGKFPLFVSEPNYEAKLHRIKHNPYLNLCYKELKNLKGSLFIHGHSMDENDKHIFDQINKSEVNKIYISIFGDEYSETNRTTMANARRFIETRNIDIEFYDAESAPIWK
ncbi:hypothetical protein MWMV10_MWMV10_01618 [Acinetobacter baumannii]|nr:hypothetical protein MWMV10_MWMV10_01618 [Acinetobacter baumannii]CAI4207257.1 hypothetical protein MWMV15_MWMV15_01563 [Acinetobacter baumannii]